MYLPQEPGALADEVVRWLLPAQNGSSEALGRVLQMCRQYLLLVANRELDLVLQAKIGPSDLVQDTLLEAQRDFGSFHGTTEADVRAWLRRILLNNVANVRERYRSTYKRDIGREVPLDRALERSGQAALVDHEPSPSGRALASERRATLERALAQLPENYREALRLRHQENHSFAEIGRHMSRSSEAARKLWSRAVDELRKILKVSHDLP